MPWPRIICSRKTFRSRASPASSSSSPGSISSPAARTEHGNRRIPAVLAALDQPRGDRRGGGGPPIPRGPPFAAPLNPIVLAGGKPVLVDVEPDTYNMDVSQLEGAITKHTRAIVPVHFAGLPVDLDPLYALAAKHGLRG